MSEEKKEECGIIAIISKTGKPVAPLMYNALLALQHRGQDAAGFTVLGTDGLESRKGIGLVSDIFKTQDLTIPGTLGIGHTRYPTIGKCQMCDVQPSVIGNVALSHNGHLANYDELKKELEEGSKKIESTVDSEPITMLLEEKLNEGIEAAVRHVMEKLDGAYSDCAIVNGNLIVFRDPHAIRPLIWGENDDYICFASESVALDINGLEYKGEVDGGELVIVEQGGSMSRKSLLPKETRHCMFEYVYFSRPDSQINGKLVHGVREKLGEQLAKEHPADADVVVPVPDTSRTAARTFAKAAGIEYEEGLIKNRYVARTFIMPNQEMRKQAVRVKLNPIKTVIEGKRVVLVDDSIVRGTTLREIVRMVRNAGAKEIHVRITSPPIKAPCFYGVDMSTYEELIANNKSIDEIKGYIGADSLGYLSIDGLKKAIDLPVCTGCLNEEYITDYAKKLAGERKSVSSCG
jgi:amidophosphoribosyltransferase